LLQCNRDSCRKSLKVQQYGPTMESELLLIIQFKPRILLTIHLPPMGDRGK